MSFSVRADGELNAVEISSLSPGDDRHPAGGRVLIVAGRNAESAIDYGVGLIGGERPVVDLVLLWRERRILTGFAVNAGCPVAALDQLAEQEAVAEARSLLRRWPAHLGIRFSVVGDGNRKSLEQQLASREYDLIIAPSPGFSLRHRRLVRLLRNHGAELLYYS